MPEYVVEMERGKKKFLGLLNWPWNFHFETAVVEILFPLGWALTLCWLLRVSSRRGLQPGGDLVSEVHTAHDCAQPMPCHFPGCDLQIRWLGDISSFSPHSSFPLLIPQCLPSLVLSVLISDHIRFITSFPSFSCTASAVCSFLCCFACLLPDLYFSRYMD